MLQFYYSRLSTNARRVWVTLLEKNLEFEGILVNLGGDQFKPEFLALNPFHHIPVLVDDGFTVVESLAIMDYLNVKYPTPALMPMDAQDIATVRMIELVTQNELSGAIIPLLRRMLEVPIPPEQITQAEQSVNTVLQFFEARLHPDSSYFIGEQLTLADIAAGTIVTYLPLLGVSLEAFPKVQAWCDRLEERPSWQETTPTPAEIIQFKARMKQLLENR